jgi:hypothetical protein
MAQFKVGLLSSNFLGGTEKNNKNLVINIGDALDLCGRGPLPTLVTSSSLKQDEHDEHVLLQASTDS